MASLAKPSVDGRPASEAGMAKLRELPTLQAGARNGGPHPLQMQILFENLELDHSMAWASLGGHRNLGKPRHGERVVDELHILQ
jgi:hypothetical protein